MKRWLSATLIIIFWIVVWIFIIPSLPFVKINNYEIYYIAGIIGIIISLRIYIRKPKRK
jgi:uncharacterized membrane-anchored protein